MHPRSRVFAALQFLATGFFCAFMFISAFESRSWWQAMFFAGLGSFVIQVAIGFAQSFRLGNASVTTSEFQRRLSQFFVLIAAFGFIGTLFSRYA